jgi:hypothetical protein
MAKNISFCFKVFIGILMSLAVASNGWALRSADLPSRQNGLPAEMEIESTNVF